MALGIGQHTNDKELSYYVRDAVRLRVGGRLESRSSSESRPPGSPPPTEGITIWGHTVEGETVIDKLNQFRHGAARCATRGDHRRRH